MMGLCLWSTLWIYGQYPANIVYSYDNDGNRIGTRIYFTKSVDNESLKDHVLLPSVVDTLNTVEVCIFPNPTSDKIVVATSGKENDQTLKAVLLSMNGEILDEKTISDFQESFDLSGNASGIYLLELYMDQKKHIWKIIKR